jgi:hypothetical protein
MLDRIHHIFLTCNGKAGAAAEAWYELRRHHVGKRKRKNFRRSAMFFMGYGGQAWLLPRPRFLERVQCEQDRAFDINSTMSIAIFSVAGKDTESRQVLHDFSSILADRVRDTDIGGWYARNSVAVLILDTDEAGAAACVNRLQDLAGSRGIDVAMRQYSKPTPVINGEGESRVPPMYIGDSLKFSHALMAPL